jgi:hypothetical protein
VWRVVQPAPRAIRSARLGVGPPDLVERCVHTVEREQAILRPVDDEERARRDECRDVRKVEIAIETVDVKRQAHGIHDVLLDLRAERRHPPNVDRHLDTFVERAEEKAPVAAH